jgi:hypothetical protein
VDNKAKWTIAPDVRATYSEDGAVLLDINKGLCYSLNGAAARIWVTIEASQGGVTVEGIVGALETQFKVSRQELECDTAECLVELQGMGLIHRNRPFHGFKAAGGR